jgi:alpha-beta hydrolase superfamily lysophospholipase
MAHQALEWITKDKLKLKGSSWTLDKVAKANVIIVHGLGEHHARYEHVARLFNSSGINVYAYDQRGHGLSDGKKGFSPTHQHLLDDLDVIKEYVLSQEAIPLFMYGHSFGGNVLTTYLINSHDLSVKGAIISSAWFKLAFEPPKFEVALGRFMNNIWPAFSQSNQLNHNDLTYDEELNNTYAEDPLVHDRISAALFVNAYSAGYWCLENADRLQTPSLLIHGEDDPIISLEGSRVFHQKAKNADLMVWSQTKHEPHNDKRKGEVIEHLIDWVLAKLV